MSFKKWPEAQIGPLKANSDEKPKAATIVVKSTSTMETSDKAPIEVTPIPASRKRANLVRLLNANGYTQ